VNQVVQALGSTQRSLYKWVERYHWRERIAAYDQEVSRAQLDNEKKAREDVDKRHRKLSLRLYQILAQRLVGDEGAGIRPLDPNLIGPTEWVRMMELAVRVERLAHGMELDRRTNRNQEQVEVAVKVETGKFDSVAANLAYQFLERVNQNGSGEPIDLQALPPPEPEPLEGQAEVIAEEKEVPPQPEPVPNSGIRLESSPEQVSNPLPSGVCNRCGEELPKGKVGRPRKFCEKCDSRARGVKKRGRPKKEALKCDWCGKPMRRLRSNSRFCSNPCLIAHGDYSRDLNSQLNSQRRQENRVLGVL
jgi:hypothetical protein